MPDIPNEYDYVIIHNKGKFPCNKIAMYVKGMLYEGDLLEYSRFMSPYGISPVQGSKIICPVCLADTLNSYTCTIQKRDFRNVIKA